MKFSNQTKEELIKLGFHLWSSDQELMLIPYKLYGEIEVGEELTCISGESGVVVSNDGKDCMWKSASQISRVDDDYRCGMLAYGVIPSKEPKIFANMNLLGDLLKEKL